MTENKRFKYYVFDGFEDNGKQMSSQEVEETLNKFQELSIEDLKKIEQLEKENKQLQSELSRYKEVNRLDIWKSFYSSEDALITELQNKCDKKQEHIVILENKIRRMREAIHKLEWLATHRNAELIRENEQLKQQCKDFMEMLDDMSIAYLVNDGLEEILND